MTAAGRTLPRNETRQKESFPANSHVPVLINETQSYESGIRCHGCHRYGHFVIDCKDCYKCNRCGKHHLNGNPCSSNAFIGDAGKSDLFSPSGSVDGGDRGGRRGNPVAEERHPFASIDGDYKNNEGPANPYSCFPYHIPDGVSATAPHNFQTEMHSRQIDGHVTHTVTHTVIEVCSPDTCYVADNLYI